MIGTHILFLHIPKTAGTSFRISAQEYFGEDNTFFDYTINAKDTSQKIIETIYKAGDMYQLSSMVTQKKHSFLSGHHPMARYLPLYNTYDIVSFVRDPVSQVLSHYNHYKNMYGYTESFVDFISDPKFQNIQTKNLGGKPLALYGFLGLTEEYLLSLKIFNSIYGTDLSYRYLNKSEKSSIKLSDIDEDTLEFIKVTNSKDIQLYNIVKRDFKIQKKLYLKGLPYTYGRIHQRDHRRIVGWAFQKRDDSALEIDIYCNDRYLKSVFTTQMRVGMRVHNVPRCGFIGFSYVHDGICSEGEHLRAFVRKTGQEIL